MQSNEVINIFSGEFDGGSSAEPTAQDADVVIVTADVPTAESTACVSSPAKTTQAEPDAETVADSIIEDESVTVTETKEVVDAKQENKSVSENEHVLHLRKLLLLIH